MTKVTSPRADIKMERGFTHPTPGDLMKDEEKWFAIFSKKSLAAVMVASVVGGILCALLTVFGLGVVGIILLVALDVTVFIGFSMTRSVESARYRGGGKYYYVIWLCILYRWISRRIYVKGYKRINAERHGKEEWL